MLLQKDWNVVRFGNSVFQYTWRAPWEMGQLHFKVRCVLLVEASLSKMGDGEYIRWESIDRFRVNTPATKALMKVEGGKWQLKRRHFNYWIICFAIALATGIIEFFNFEGLSFIQGSRIKLAKMILEHTHNSGGGVFAAWIIYSLISVLVVCAGCTLVVFWAPMAKGGTPVAHPVFVCQPSLCRWYS
jgi:hypothetical protein